MTTRGPILRPVERPGGRSFARWAFDVLVVFVAWVAALPNVVHGEQDGPQSRALVLVLALLLLPLIVRRLWPVPVFAWMAVVSAGFLIWNVQAVPGLAVLMALFTVTVTQPRRIAYASAALVEVGIVIASVILLDRGWWRGAILLTGTLAAALAFGLYIGTRRAYLRGLQDRAVILERERDQQGELAAAAERARIAREMHDIIGHHLTVMIALSDGAAAASTTSPQKAAEVMRSVSETGRTALGETRRLLGVLRETAAEPERTPLPDLDGVVTLVEQVRAAGLPVTIAVHGNPMPLLAGLQLTVYRLVQEALTNCLKHAGEGASAVVRFDYAAGALHLVVEDNGVGAARAPGRGGGLAGMRERVHAYGGRVTSGPRLGGGWSVSVELPLRTPA